MCWPWQAALNQPRLLLTLHPQQDYREISLSSPSLTSPFIGSFRPPHSVHATPIHSSIADFSVVCFNSTNPCSWISSLILILPFNLPSPPQFLCFLLNSSYSKCTRRSAKGLPRGSPANIYLHLETVWSSLQKHIIQVQAHFWREKTQLSNYHLYTETFLCLSHSFAKAAFIIYFLFVKITFFKVGSDLGVNVYCFRWHTTNFWQHLGTLLCNSFHIRKFQLLNTPYHLQGNLGRLPLFYPFSLLSTFSSKAKNVPS